MKLKLYFPHDDGTMALFGNDRPVMPSFRTAPEPDSSTRSPYDDLNRIERNIERNGRHLEQDARSDRDERERKDRGRDERDLERYAVRNGDRRSEREAEHPERAAAPEIAASATHMPRLGAQKTHPLIEGLFDKLPEAETDWSLQGRQKWLQTAANIFDLMYLPNESDAGELAIRVDRPSSVR